MASKQWRQIEELYHAALTRTGEARARFLSEACVGNPALRREVELLLAQAASAEGLLAHLSMATATHLASEPSVSALTGRRIGTYIIRERLGVGGMGEVYRAHDLKLLRDVAIKFLPLGFARDPDRLARFNREARLLAALNHPNVAAIYGVEDSEETPSIVMELVEGQTLAALIARGPLPLHDALRLSRQIVDALDAAHEKGIIHRDLKPANIALTGDGVVKVLDFGLGRMVGPYVGGEAESHSPTISLDRTHDGLVMGTAAYMSPEQARGRPMDKRTDIWAFGCVLYEMLTSRAAFQGETISDTIAAVLERQPAWQALPAATPASVQRLLRRCLDKDPKRRFRDIGDVRFGLDDAETVPGPDAPTIVSKWRAWHRMAAAAAAVALLGGAFMARGLIRPAPAAAAEVRVHQLTDMRGLEEFPAISPDGKSVAFVAHTAGNVQNLRAPRRWWNTASNHARRR